MQDALKILLLNISPSLKDCQGFHLNLNQVLLTISHNQYVQQKELLKKEKTHMSE
jgi:hypothetical protein